MRWSNDGTQTFTKNSISTTRGGNIVIIDMDHDGDIDIVVGDRDAEDIVW